MLCGTFMNPAPIPSLRHRCAVRGNPRFLVCGICVPLNGASAGVRGERGDASKRRSPLPGNACFDPKHIWKVDNKNSRFAVSAFKNHGLFPGVPKIPFRAALQPSPAGHIRKTVSVLAGLSPVTLRSVSESLSGFAFAFKAPPRKDIIGSLQRREERAYH